MYLVLVYALIIVCPIAFPNSGGTALPICLQIDVFGPVKTKITVEDKKGRVLDQHTFSLNNDGCAVSEYNLKGIRWYDDKIEVDIKGDDDYQSTEYVLDLG